MDKALITGGSSGIGLELAKIMAGKGHTVVLVSRDKAALESAAAMLAKTYGVEVEIVVSDLSIAGSGLELYEKLKDKDIRILVNNAGVGYVADFFDGDLQKDQTMAQLNMISVMDLCYYFGRDFRGQNAGKILNIASIAAFVPGPPQPVYYATKAFVRSFSRALAYNLRGTNVSITTLHPGVTRTNFLNQANAPQVQKGADPNAVAQAGYDAMMKGKVEVTFGLGNKFLTNVVVRFIPYRWQTAAIGRLSKV